MWTANKTIFLRRPIKQPDDFLAWSAGTANTSSVEERYQQLAERLLPLFGDDYCGTALYLASPSLHARVQQYLTGSKPGQLAEVIPQLASYWSRMCFRPTPFGLFAGVGAAPLNAVKHSDQPVPIPHLRIDLAVATNVSEQLLSDRDLRRTLQYRNNDTIRHLGNTVTYIEPFRSGMSKSYRRSQVEKTPHLDRILRLSEGWSTYQNLSQSLSEYDPELSQQEIDEFLHELIDAGLLIPNITFSANNVSPMAQLQATLPKSSKKRLIALTDQLAEMSWPKSAGPATDIEALSNKVITALVDEGIKPPRGGPFQVDTLLQNLSHQLNPSLVASVTRDFRRLASAFNSRPSALDNFRKNFFEKFGHSEVALLEALDENDGVALQTSHYEASLISGLPLQKKLASSCTLDHLEQWLIQKSFQAAQAGASEILLTEQDLDSLTLEKNPQPLPDLYCLMLSLWAAENQSTTTDDKCQLAVLEGFSPGLGLIGRFCHLDPALHVTAIDLAREESVAARCVLAEVNYLPPDRVGNIALRPPIYDYEIPVLTHESRDEPNVIRLADLTLSMQNDRLILRSKKLDCEVLPRLPNAHNFIASSMPVYRLLAQLQYEGKSFFRFSLSQVEHLLCTVPQIRYNNVILSRRRWRLHSNQISHNKSEALNDRLAAVAELIKLADLPRFVSIVRGDQLLMLDLDNPIYQAVLYDELKSQQQLLLEDGGVIAGSRWHSPTENGVSTEIVLPFVRTPADTGVQPEAKARSAKSTTKPVRRELPGGEWIYAKIYAKPHVIDEILKDHLDKLIKGTYAEVKYFFVRYQDRDWHLRIRFHTPSMRSKNEFSDHLSYWTRSLQQRNLTNEVQIDTYERETSRYGGDQALSLCEQYFCADSEFVVNVINKISDSDSDRWLATLVSISEIMKDFRLNDSDRFSLITRLREGYGNEFGESSATRKAMGIMYQKNKQVIEQALIDNRWLREDALIDIRTAIERRRSMTAPIIEKLLSMDQNHELHSELVRIVESIIHMATNRMLLIHFREQELVLYDFLRRFLLSKLNRPTETRCKFDLHQSA